MKKRVLFILLNIFNFGLNAQNDDFNFRVTEASEIQIKSIEANKIDNETTKEDAKLYALNDIEKENIFLFLKNPMSFSYEQVEFEKKYKIFYFRREKLSSYENKKQYNFQVLYAIKKKYGIEIIEKISTDVIGLNEWKTQQ